MKKSTQIVHDAYKKLAAVESAFRTIKTTCLEVRPIYVRKKTRTKGHVFLTFLSFILINEFESKLKGKLNNTTQNNINLLNQIQTVTLTILDDTLKKIPSLSSEATLLLDALDISLPSKSVLNKALK